MTYDVIAQVGEILAFVCLILLALNLNHRLLLLTTIVHDLILLTEEMARQNVES